MDWATTTQALLVFALGVLGTLLTSWITDRRQRRSHEAELDRADRRRVEEIERSERNRRWEIGRDSALGAIGRLRAIEVRMVDAEGQPRDWLGEERSTVMAGIELLPDAELRRRTDWVMQSTFIHPMTGRFVYQPGDGRDYSYKALTELIEELGAFARGETVPPNSWLADYVDRVENWYTELVFTCTA